jgi:prepilin-type processing-associated H-X9-DG protein
MGCPLHSFTLGCGTIGLLGMSAGWVGLLVLVAAIFFGLLYGISRIWCRPKLALRLTLLGVIASGVALTPAFHMARVKALRTTANCHLKQIGTALALFGEERQNILPDTLHELVQKGYLPEHILIDPETGEPFVYVGAGKVWQSTTASDEIVAYSPRDTGGHNVLFIDGHVEWLTSEAFAKAMKASGRS